MVSLNPYSIGIWSATGNEHLLGTTNKPVLILILLEYGLRRQNEDSAKFAAYVLILILLEYGLRQG